MDLPIGDPPSELPYFHYMTERDRLNRYSAVKRTTVLASLPERCPYRARSSPKNSKKLELGWLEFHSPEPPDPEVARPGDVWIQIPLDFDLTAGTPDASVCRLFVCYSIEGRQWTLWEGDERVHSNDPPVGIHPLASPAMWDGTTKRDAQYYLAFTGSEFTWVSGTRLSVIGGQWRLGRLPGDWMKRLIAEHSIDGIPFLPPAEAIAAWAERKTITASGVQKRKEKKRVSNEPTPELPSTKRWKPENETSSNGAVQGWQPVADHSPNETAAISHPYSLVSWPHVSHWTVMRPSVPRPSTPPSSSPPDEPIDAPTTPPSPTFVLRPATFAPPSSPANESQPSDDPPPTPPSPVPQLQLPPTESRPPPTMYPHVSFTPTLSPPRYGERARKQVIRFATLPVTTVGGQSASGGSSTPVIGSTSASTLSMTDPSISTEQTSISAPPIAEGRRAPVGAIDTPPKVRGRYAKAGAAQRGWSLYVGETELLMPFPCDKCKRAGAICSGLEGERCGRCRAIRKPCSHNTQPRPSVSKSDPPGAKFVSPLSVSSAEKGHVSLYANKDEGEVRSRSADERIASDKVALKSRVGRVIGNSNAPNAAPPLKSSAAHNISVAESQDEDDNAVEELMYPDSREEENVGVGTVAEIAQGNAVALGTVDTQDSAATFTSRVAVPERTSTLLDDSAADCPRDNVHTDPSFGSTAEATCVNISTGAPTMTMKPIDRRCSSNLPHSKHVEDHEGSNTLLNDCVMGPSKGLCHLGPPERWNPASHTVFHDFQESPNNPEFRNIVNGPLSDPADAPALDCSQEVCIRAADGAAVGGGSLSATQAPISGVSSYTGLQEGCAPSAAATPPAPPHELTTTSPPQVTDEGPTPTDRMSVDEEIVRFMEITLTGMAQVQDGLRGVFAIQKRRRAVQKRKMAVGGDK